MAVYLLHHYKTKLHMVSRKMRCMKENNVRRQKPRHLPGPGSAGVGGCGFDGGEESVAWVVPYLAGVFFGCRWNVRTWKQIDFVLVMGLRMYS